MVRIGILMVCAVLVVGCQGPTNKQGMRTSGSGQVDAPESALASSDTLEIPVTPDHFDAEGTMLYRENRGIFLMEKAVKVDSVTVSRVKSSPEEIGGHLHFSSTLTNLTKDWIHVRAWIHAVDKFGNVISNGQRNWEYLDLEPGKAHVFEKPVHNKMAHTLILELSQRRNAAYRSEVGEVIPPERN